MDDTQRINAEDKSVGSAGNEVRFTIIHQGKWSVVDPLVDIYLNDEFYAEGSIKHGFVVTGKANQQTYKLRFSIRNSQRIPGYRGLERNLNFTIPGYYYVLGLYSRGIGDFANVEVLRTDEPVPVTPRLIADMWRSARKKELIAGLHSAWWKIKRTTAGVVCCALGMTYYQQNYPLKAIIAGLAILTGIGCFWSVVERDSKG